ncbi:MAG TPA: class I SAM-dependent DNA methyltransferase [Candidatus Limnocylindrales bacterium]
MAAGHAPKENDERRGPKTAAPLPFVDRLWLSADKLRGQMEEGDYKHVVLGLIFLKYVSDSFERRRAEIERLTAEESNDEYFLRTPAQRAAALEDRDYYEAASVSWVPEEARWDFLQRNAKQVNIGRLVDDAMELIEKENPRLTGVLPKGFARPEIRPDLIGGLIDLFSGVGVRGEEGSSEDILGRVYEYFLNRFGTNEGGQYYTPQYVVRLLVEMLEPFKGQVYDPCCGSGGMFVQSMAFVDAHHGRRGDVSIFGQEAVPATWRIAKMNLAVRHIDANLGTSWGDSFHEDKHPDLRADFVIANPPFNMSDWGGDRLRQDPRWAYGVPPAGNANFAWVQHFLSHLNASGTAGFVLANGALSVQGIEGEIRREIIEADLVDCVVALPRNLFFGTTIPVSLWFLAKSKNGDGHRDRRGESLFIDAREMGTMVTTSHRVLSQHEVERVAEVYKAWRGRDGRYEDVPEFCRATRSEEIAANRYVLTPGRYVRVRDRVDSEDIDSTITALRLDLADRLDRVRELADLVSDRLSALD